MGQMWPVFRKFDGERGNTIGIGLTAALSLGHEADLAYIIFTVGAICILTGILFRTIPRFIKKDQTFDERLKLGGPASNSMPLGMLTGFAAMPLVSWFIDQPPEMTLALAIVFLLIIIRRLTANILSDLKKPAIPIRKILINRALYDRSYFQG